MALKGGNSYVSNCLQLTIGKHWNMALGSTIIRFSNFMEVLFWNGPCMGSMHDVPTRRNQKCLLWFSPCGVRHFRGERSSGEKESQGAIGIFTEIIESLKHHHERQSGSTRRSSGTGQAGTVKLHSAFLRILIRSVLCLSYFCLIKRPSIAIVASTSK